MAVRIRLSRGGSKKRPFYRVVAADSRAPRDGRYIERLGTYNPLLPVDHAERFVLDVEKTKAWLSKGAEATDRLQKLLAGLGLCEAPTYDKQTKQALPKSKAQQMLKEKAAKEEAKIAAEKQAIEDAKAAKEAEKQAAKEAAEAAKAAAEAPVAEEAPAAE